MGITFDGVKTAPDADEQSISKPLTPMQKRYFQAEVDSIYAGFLQRVATGRNKSVSYVDSIAQGRVWTGTKALELGLVDKLGGLQDAVDCAARLAKTSNYRLKEYPEPKGFLDILLGGYKKSFGTSAIKEELGDKTYRTLITLKDLQLFKGSPQARMPFELEIE